MIKEQVDVLKSNVGIRVRALNDDAAKLLAKWDQLKPKSDALQVLTPNIGKSLN